MAFLLSAYKRTITYPCVLGNLTCFAEASRACFRVCSQFTGVIGHAIEVHCCSVGGHECILNIARFPLQQCIVSEDW